MVASGKYEVSILWATEGPGSGSDTPASMGNLPAVTPVSRNSGKERCPIRPGGHRETDRFPSTADARERIGGLLRDRATRDRYTDPYAL
jgi:hypothetical protein